MKYSIEMSNVGLNPGLNRLLNKVKHFNIKFRRAEFASNYLSEVVLSYLCLLQFKLSTVFSFHNIDYYTENKNN